MLIAHLFFLLSLGTKDWPLYHCVITRGNKTPCSVLPSHNVIRVSAIKREVAVVGLLTRFLLTAFLFVVRRRPSVFIKETSTLDHDDLLPRGWERPSENTLRHLLYHQKRWEAEGSLRCSQIRVHQCLLPHFWSISYFMHILLSFALKCIAHTWLFNQKYKSAIHEYDWMIDFMSVCIHTWYIYIYELKELKLFCVTKLYCIYS